MAQRLVRVLCPLCKQPHAVTSEEVERLGLSREKLIEMMPDDVSDRKKHEDPTFWRPVGCSECLSTGYRGRTGIYELLMIDDEIRSLVMSGVDSSSIKKRALQRGMLTLRDDGVRLALRGVTSLEEVLRVTQEDQV
jgi:general secretion pathway protein E